MTEIATLLAICVIDWLFAIRAMAYRTTRVAASSTGIPLPIDADDLLVYSDVLEVPPKMHPFYERKALGTDMFHIVGWPRYLALGWVAWMGFGWTWWLYVATAITCSAGWLVLKVVHGKDKHWGLKPRWLKRIWP